MGWKNVFKLNWKKIISAILIWLVVPTYHCQTILKGPNIGEIACSTYPYLGGVFSLLQYFVDFHFINALYDLLFLLVAYFVVCITIFFHNKTKK